MRKSLRIILFVLMFSLTGCNGIGTPSNNPLDATITPTPFQPAAEVAMTSTPAWTLTPTPDESKIISLGLARPEGQVNILLLGSDFRPGLGYRTDVMMLLSLMPDQNLITLTSFPRDLYVDLPGYGYERINAALEFGGFPLVQETFDYNFDVPVDYYMLTDFTGFVSIIDTLGGITVNATYELYDTCDLPQAVDHMCYVPAGRITMNGETALWYVRSRYSTNDFDRTRRAQEVITAIVQKTMSLDALNRAAELFDLFRYSVETDIPFDLIVKMLPLAANYFQDPTILQRYAISEADVTDYLVPVSGAMVVIPNNDAVAKIIQQAIYPLQEPHN